MSELTTPTRRIATFLALVIFFTAGFWWLSWLSASGQWQFGGQKARELFVTGLMWCPGIAALLACRLTSKPWRELGMELPQARYLGLAFGFPLACMAIAYGVLWGSGAVAFDAAPFVDAARRKFSLPDSSTTLVFALSFLVTATIGVLGELGRSLGEELGWRGFLVPELLRRHGLAASSLLSGLIWGLWHFPLLIPLGSEIPMVAMLAFFLVSVVSISAVAAWLRWRSGSVWPAVVLHSAHNALLYPFFDALGTAVGETGKYAAGEAGFAMAATYALGAMVFWRVTRAGKVCAHAAS